MDKIQRAIAIAEKLKELFPGAKIALNYSTTWELLVAVILSAQCPDKKVNEVTAKLFNKYKTFDDYLKVGLSDFEKDISSINFYHNKAKNILATAQLIKENFNGKVPNSMEDLLTLPGVARKTANVVLGNAYNIIEGIVVDTHVKRFAQKFELVDSDDPVKIEKQLMELLPKDDWFSFSYGLIMYGREICPARPHECEDHELTKIYPKAANIWPKS